MGRRNRFGSTPIRIAAATIGAMTSHSRGGDPEDRKSTRLNSSHEWSSYAVFCLKKKREDCCVGSSEGSPEECMKGPTCRVAAKRSRLRLGHPQFVWKAAVQVLGDCGE